MRANLVLRRQISSLVMAGLIFIIGTSRGAEAVAGDVAFGQYLSSECVTCHQLSGKTDGSIPSIIGWTESSFTAVLDAYRKKERPHPTMQTIAARLSDDEIAALASYFATITK